MAKRYSEEWKRNVSEGVKNAVKICSEETRKKLSAAAKKGNASRVYRRKPKEELKSWTWFRERFFEERGRICERCGWCKKHPVTNLPPVQIHHIDGNHENRDDSNLIVLCPNCHSLTSNFMNYGGS